MADITKCLGTGCPLRDGCYRYTAPAGEYQWYAGFTCDPETGCPDFLRDERRESGSVSDPDKVTDK